MEAFLGMMIKKKSFVLALIFLILMMSFSGCGKKEGAQTGTKTPSKNCVYKMEDIDLEEKNQNVNNVFLSGDAIYASGYRWADDGRDAALVFSKVNMDGKLEGQYPIPVDENTSLGNVKMDDEQNIYCIKNDFYPVSSTSDEYVDDYYFVKMTLSGEELFSVKLNDLPDLKRLGDENGYFYISDLILDQKNGVYLCSYGHFFKFDLEGNYVGAIAGDGEGENLLDGATFLTLEDGQNVAILYGENGMSAAFVDLDKGTVKEKYEIPGTSYEYSYYAGKGYDLYMVNTYGVYGYNLGDTDKTQLMSYIDSDFDIYNIYQVVGIDEQNFIAMHDSLETGENTLAKFVKVPPEEVKEKQEITLALSDFNWTIRRSVIKFNKESEQYRISILDYNSLYGSDDDYMAGINRLNTDIASGKVPDILLINNSMPVESYISKGLFEDLKPYIQQDAELDMNNFMPNIVEAFSVNGKMYTLVPSYIIETLIAKSSDVGDERGWTVQEAKELLDSKPEGTQFLSNMTRESMLDYCMSMSGSQFVDWENGTCSFNTDSFIQMLEFIAAFPDEIDDEMYTDDYWNNYESLWREGKVIASFNSFGNFRNYNYTEKGTFGEDITMIGFPSSDMDGSVIVPDMQIAMSAKSKNKEGVWEFLRVFLTDEYQEEGIYGFPVSIKRLNELAQEATQKPYYTDENGNKVEYDDSYYVAGQEIIIPPMTKQETEEFMEQLYSFTQVYKRDETLLNIIEEEVAPFFSGQKNVKDVVSVIQSRAQIYINENR